MANLNGGVSVQTTAASLETVERALGDLCNSTSNADVTANANNRGGGGRRGGSNATRQNSRTSTQREDGGQKFLWQKLPESGRLEGTMKLRMKDTSPVFVVCHCSTSTCIFFNINTQFSFASLSE
jgi:hypothetical protein